MRMSADLRDLFLYEAFLYYNPLLLVVSLIHCCVCINCRKDDKISYS
jgi:hypothetical protein